MIHENKMKKWMQDWVDIISQVKYENSFNEKSDEGIGRFKGLEIVSEKCEITIKLKCDVWDNNVL
jgi:hypothetical protein